MYEWNENVKVFTPNGASLEFVEFEKDGIKYYGFNSCECVPPEPMVNAIIGLKLLKNENEKLIMINHRSPMGLFPKIDGFFTYETQELSDGVKITFSYIKDKSDKAVLNDSHCAG